MSERLSDEALGTDQETVDLYHTLLTPEEAEQYFQRVQRGLEAARSRPYKNLMGRVRGHLDDKHGRALIDSVGILLALSTQECVMQGNVPGITQKSLSNSLADVMGFLSDFKNTGVQVIPGGRVFPTMQAMLQGKDIHRQ